MRPEDGGDPFRRPDNTAAQDRRAGVVLVLIFVLVAAVGLIVGGADETSSSGRARAPRTDPTGVIDTFDVDGALGADGGLPWRDVIGEWAAEGGTARVLKPGPSRNMAVITSTGADARAGVTVAKVGANSGLVFRFRDRSNYWQVVAVPAYSTWNLQKVVNGRPTAVRNTGLSPVQDGTRIEVQLSGPTITVIIAGIQRLQVNDNHARHARGLGLIAIGRGAAEVRWDDFKVGVVEADFVGQLPPAVAPMGGGTPGPRPTTTSSGVPPRSSTSSSTSSSTVPRGTVQRTQPKVQ